MSSKFRPVRRTEIGHAEGTGSGRPPYAQRLQPRKPRLDLIALRGDRTQHGVRAGLRLLLSEWPLVVATVPTPVLLLVAAWGWWPSAGIEYVTFAVNVVLLFVRGLLAARAAGRTWGSGLKIGTVDALLGLTVVVANALSK
ncbi:hypothetical protein [Streptomyces neyagawaensis]|uniref:Integral membrane protein n=1 Tax=Streptomyces neyagawaensis TaxID=42238 RepID=A0ABV3AQM1_9ACTN